jgi:aminopeptidase N
LKIIYSYLIKYLALFAVLLFLCTGINAQKKQWHFTHQDTLRGSLNAARMYDVKFYDLFIKVEPDKKYISGSNEIRFVAEENLDSLQIDLFANMELDSIVFEQKKLKYTRDGDHIFTYLPHKIMKGSNVIVKIYYQGHPHEAIKPPWDGGFVWSKDSLGYDWIGVACEGVGASLWWPCKDYLGDEPDSMGINITIPCTQQCNIGPPCEILPVANGQLMLPVKWGKTVNFRERKREFKFQYFINYPINTYDVTINIGHFSSVRDSIIYIDSKLLLNFKVVSHGVSYSDPRKFNDRVSAKEKAQSYFPPRVKNMLECFEHYFGPYPFPKDGYSLVETPYWGMEHQSCIAYGNNFKDSTLGFNFDFILIHESAHEWWGNSLSCSDEAEMWLHESFATYAEALYVEYYWGYEKSIEYLVKQKPRIANKEPVIGPFGVNYHNRPDNDIYYKGSWMLHTLRSAINNDSLWFKIIYTYADKFKRSIVHTEDFVKLVNAMTGKDYTNFFDEYLRHEELPVLEYTVKTTRHKLKLRYKWIADVKNFDMPIDVKSGNKNYRINPQAQWQKTSIPLDADWRFDNNRFLFKTKL